MPLHYPEGPFVAQSDELQRLARESRFSMVKVAVAINFIAKIRREDLMNYLSILASASEAGYYTSVLCDRAHRLSQATVGSQTTDDVPDSGEAAVSGSLRVVHTWCKGRFFRPRERARGREVRRQPAASATVSSPHSRNTHSAGVLKQFFHTYWCCLSVSSLALLALTGIDYSSTPSDLASSLRADCEMHRALATLFITRSRLNLVRDTHP